jgi:hypothetical protein
MLSPVGVDESPPDGEAFFSAYAAPVVPDAPSIAG